MANTLIVYETNEGHTANIAMFIADINRENGHMAEVIDVKHIPFNFSLDKFDSFIFGASIHLNHFPSEIKSFISTYHSVIENRPTAFFSVSLTEATPGPMAKVKLENN